jgi:hypothetical protein
MIAPHISRVALMFNPATSPYGAGFLDSFETAAKSFAVEASGALLHDPAEIEGAMIALGKGGDGGLIVLPDAFTDVHRDQIIKLAARYRVPTVRAGVAAYGRGASPSPTYSWRMCCALSIVSTGWRDILPVVTMSRVPRPAHPS